MVILYGTYIYVEPLCDYPLKPTCTYCKDERLKMQTKTPSRDVLDTHKTPSGAQLKGLQPYCIL